MELQQYCGLGEYLLLGDHNLKLQVDHQSYYMSIGPLINQSYQGPHWTNWLQFKKKGPCNYCKKMGHRKVCQKYLLDHKGSKPNVGPFANNVLTQECEQVLGGYIQVIHGNYRLCFQGNFC